MTAALRFIFGAATEALASLAPAAGKPTSPQANQTTAAPDAFASFLAAVLAPAAPTTPAVSDAQQSVSGASAAATAKADTETTGIHGSSTLKISPAELDLHGASRAWMGGASELERLLASTASSRAVVSSVQQETVPTDTDKTEGAVLSADALPATVGLTITQPAAPEVASGVLISGGAGTIAIAPTSAGPTGVAVPASGDPRRVNRGVEGLNPEFRNRLERVISRMKEEHGHRVNVVETVRDQARQDHLFEQGRTRPGPVVTWTRTSQHSEGRAADVQIDGSYDNAAGFAKLARIAAEEGLRTLGARDPGHVELPGSSTARSLPHVVSASSEALPRANSVAGSQAARVTGVAQPAQVASVAQVAQLSQVASVAQVATPGAARAATPSQGRPKERIERNLQAAPAVATSPSVVAHSERPVLPVNGTVERVETEVRRYSSAEPTAQHASHSEGGLSGYGPGSFGTSSHSAAPVEGVAAGAGTDAATRLGQILEMQEGGAARPLSHVLLRMEAPGGGEERIRVDLRGTTVGTIIDVTDANAAERLNARVGELQHALEGKGLEAESVQIRAAAAKGVDASETVRTLGLAAEGEVIRSSTPSRSGSDSTPHRERGETARDPSHQGSRDPRNRSREERKGDTPQ